MTAHHSDRRHLSPCADQVQTLGQLLALRAEQDASRLAYSFLSPRGDVCEARSYAELAARARRVAALVRRYASAGDRVLLAFAPGLDFVDAYFGCQFAGVVPVPVQTPRGKACARKLPFVAGDSGVRLALSAGAVTERVQQVLGDAMPVLDLDALPSDEMAPYVAGSNELALLQYTSGSTGAPKGVMVSQRSLLANSRAIARAFQHSRESRGVIWLPAHHDMGLVGGVIQPLFCGFPVWLMSPLDFLQRPLRWLQAVSRYRATTSGGPNFAYELCVTRVQDSGPLDLDLSSWNVAFSGAEAVRSKTLERFAQRFAPVGFAARALLPCYGLAEATLLVSAAGRESPYVTQDVDARELEQKRVTPAGAGTRAHVLVSSGRAAHEHQVVVVTPSTRERCPDGQVGEIWVSGPSLADGYWQREAESDDVFRARIANDTENYLRTGDYGYLCEGELFVCGRLKDLIVIAGSNYTADDIEASCSRSHAAFHTVGSAAFGVDIGDSERLVVVQEVARPFVGREDLTVMQRALRERVAEEHALPIHEVCLVTDASIPRTSSGKVQRGVCREAYLAGTLRRLESRPLWRTAAASSAAGQTQP